MTSPRRTILGGRTEELIGARGGDRALRVSDMDGIIAELVGSILTGKKPQGFRLKISSSVWITTGTGSPEGVISADQGCMFIRTDGGVGTSLYVKETGSGNTGWAAK